MGYGVCRAWILEYMNYSQDAEGMLGGSGIVFRISVMAAAVVFAVFWARMRTDARMEGVTVFALLAGVIGSSLLVMWPLLESSAYGVVGFVAVGVCAGFFEAKWCLGFIGLNRDALFMNVLLSILLSAVLGFTAFLLDPIVPFYVVSIAMLLLMAFFDRMARSRLHATLSMVEEPCGLSDRAGAKQREEAGAGQTRTLVVSQSALRLAAIVVASFLYSIVHIGAVTLWSGSSSSDASYLIRTASNFITILVLIAFYLLKGPVKSSSLLRVTLLLTAAGLLMQTIEIDGIADVALFVSCCGNKIFDVLLWILIAETLAAAPSLVGKGVGGVVATKNGGSLVGMLLSQVVIGLAVQGALGTVGFVSLLVLLAMVTLLWVLSERVLRGDVPTASASEPSELPAKGARDAAVSFETAAAAMAQGCGLTPRETDVFLLLVRGKNRATIAAELGISQNTVHSHIIHIYQKTGAAGQQELIGSVERAMGEKLSV